MGTGFVRGRAGPVGRRQRDFEQVHDGRLERQRDEKRQDKRSDGVAEVQDHLKKKTEKKKYAR